MITGGYDNGYTSVELLRADGSQSYCSPPQLPQNRRYHTQTGLTACGGVDSGAQRSCVTLTGGSWTTSHTLVHQRGGHTAWESPLGLILLGGRYSPKTTEILRNNSSEDLFNLKYPS